MTRPPRLRIHAWMACCGVALGLAGAVACGPPTETRPNLLLVTVDSTRADFLGCYGGDPSVGREMCALADAGVRYTWAFSAAPNSAPAIASILGSTYPSIHGVSSSPATFLREDTTTLPDVLRDSGYTTAAFVGSPELNRSRNLQHGFDLYDDAPPGGGEQRRAPERRGEELTDAALAWTQDARRPWFVWIHYHDPHGPYDAPVDTASARVPVDPNEDSAPRSDVMGRGERLRVLPIATRRGGIPGYQALPGLFTREAYELRYAAEIRYVDGQVGRLLSQLSARGVALGVALTADHGEAFGEDLYYFTHGHSVGLDQIRVPLFWLPPRSEAPGSASGLGAVAESIDVPVTTLDIGPTLLRAAGLFAPESFLGRALPAATDVVGAPQLARAIFAEGEEQVAVIVGSNYYARDRKTPPLEDGRPSATGLLAANARTARLPESNSSDARTRLPAYQPARPAGAAEVLEPRLAAFLSGEPFDETGSD